MRQGLVFSIIVSIVFCAPVLAYDWSTNPGDGSQGNPYQISTPEQLMSINKLNSAGVYFHLIDDIVFDPNNNPDHVFEYPVIHEFAGSLNGNDYTIYNFVFASSFSWEVGFIRSHSHYGVLENINFKNANITIGHDSFDVGVLCGINSGRIENCSVSGQITINGTSTRIGGLVGRNYYNVWDCKSSVSILHNNGYVYDIGGLIGFNEGMIEHCEASCTIESINSDISERIGGLVGWNDGPILDCHATGDIYGDYRIGGLVGENRGGWSAIAGCSAEGKVTVFGENGGGFVGYNSGTIFSSLSRASVLGLEFLGGFAGVNDGRISNCYSTGSITAPPVNEPGDVYRVRGLGGFTGVNLGNIEYSYSAGNVYADEFALDNGWVGGFVAGNAGKVTSCFWDVELQTHGVTESIGVSDGGTVIYTAGLLTSLMQQGDTFIDAGWNFAKKWWIDEANDYPRLWFEKNTPPVADAGADQRVFAFGVGFVDVQLDGTGSSDGDDNPLEYFWYNDANELIATGAEPNVALPIGEHVIDLVVNDGIEDSEPDSCVVTVIEAIETEAKLTPQVLNRDSGRPAVVGRIEFAGEVMPMLNPNEPMVLLAGQGQIEDQRQILDYSKKEDAWYLAGFFDNAALMEAITEDGVVEVTVAAKLLTGQWVYGRDSVTVK